MLPILFVTVLFSTDSTAVAEQFDNKIGPLLAIHCVECHGRTDPEGGLDLTSQRPALAGGESGPPIIAGHPDDSLLWQRVAADEMPPDKPLTPDEKNQLREWIATGAPWDSGVIDGFQVTTETRGGYDWWSLQPLSDTSPPTDVDHEWVRNTIDSFIDHRLVEQGLRPSPPADPRTLVRRLYIDLIGLPPTPEVIGAFAAEPTDEAYHQLVNSLLDSPHYGERWGRHWLDVARYGESSGFERNIARKHSWYYRDWVIQALNDDLSYDEFVRQQLTGDLDDSKTGAAAAGFLVAGVHNTTVGQSKRMKLLARQDELEEIVGVVGQAFLGLTVNCARCHDHKFDPIRSEEYYQLISALDGVRHGHREFERPEIVEQLKEVDTQLKQMRSMLDELETAKRRELLAAQQPPGGVAHNLPQPMSLWKFDQDLRDSIGSLHGVAVGGEARFENGALIVGADGCYVMSEFTDVDLTEKTLSVWLQLDHLDQRGGGAMTLQSADGSRFDSIVFGEVEPQRWMAGSDHLSRTKSFQGPAEDETSQPIHLAIVYQKDGAIVCFRNGVRYGSPYKTDVARFSSGKSRVLFGLRHTPPNEHRYLSGRIARASLYNRALTDAEVAATAKATFISTEMLVAALSDVQRSQRTQWKKEIAKLTKQREELETHRNEKVHSVVPGEPGVMRVHLRGSVTEFGEEVTPGAPAAIAGLDGEFGLSKDAPDSERRKQLADWITHESNPLFARVIVNRVWHYHFGKGLVDTPNDLGFNGGRPSHPNLLDWLAVQIRQNGLSLKWLHRLIVTSATYRQASEIRERASAADAENRWLWRYSPRRVEAEVLRDAMLQVAGVLNLSGGGPGFEDVTMTYLFGTMYYDPFDAIGEEFQRRTIYRFSPRGERMALLDTFDCPDASTTAPRRSVTTTPLQALSLLNSSFSLQMADHFAERLQREAGDDMLGQVERAWQLAVGRKPSEFESKRSRQMVSQHGLATLCRALFNLNEFVVIQ